MDKPTTKAVEITVKTKLANQNYQNTFQWFYVKEFGRTVVSLISQLNFVRQPELITITLPWVFLPWNRSWQLNTITIGVEKLSVKVVMDGSGCSVGEMEIVFNFLLRQLPRIGENLNYRLCDSDAFRCCSVRGYEDIIICTFRQSQIVEHVRTYIILMTIIIYYLGVPLLLKYIRSFGEERKHYQISDSPMALSFILRNLLIEEKGPVVSAQRRLFFSILVTATLCFSEPTSRWPAVACVWIIPFTAFDFFGTRPGAIDENIASCFPNQTYTYNIYVKLLTLPFNFKFWRRIFNSCLKKEQQNSYHQLIQNEELPSWKKTCHFFEDLFFILLYLALFIFICFFDLLFVIVLWFLYLSFPSTSFRNSLLSLFRILFTMFNLILITRSLIFCLTSAFFLLTGFYLNWDFYCPFVVPTMLLVLYGWKCWRSCVEAKYTKLKTNIYEFCEEFVDENYVFTENASMVHVPDCPLTLDIGTGTISKALYEAVRVMYLPFDDDVLLSFFARLFVVANYFLGLSVMISFSQSSAIPGELQFISTIAVGLLPFILEITWADDTLEDKLADKKLKLMLRQTIDFERRSGNIIYVRITKEERNVPLF